MKRKIWLFAIGVLLAALAVPYFSAAFVRQALQNSLELALSRQVRIQGNTRFRILPTPAILADDVIISEDPAFSLEPFAYVTLLEVHPSFMALLSGRLEANRLRLTEPSVNLMRSATGWNIQSLVTGKLSTPEVEVRNGRLNFKQGNSKSPFYLTNALVDISSATPQGDVKIYFSAEPARTDRGAQGFGAFSLRGDVHAPPSKVPTIDFDVELQPSSIHAYNFFFGARGVDFAGKLAGKGHIEGPWDQAAIQASLQFEGLEPKGFLPFSGRSNMVSLAGILNIPGQKLALDTVGGDSLRLRMRAREFFQAPKGALLLELREVELPKLQELGRQANARMPEGLVGEGKFNGVVGYSWPSEEAVPAKGMIWFSDARIDLPDQPRLEIPAARAIVEGSRWILAPAEIRVGESQTAVMQADWNARSGALSLDVATQLLSVKGLKTGLGLLLQASNLPLLAKAQGGTWQGNLHYERNEDSDPGDWSGRLVVRNTSVDLDGISAPVDISNASIIFDPSRVTVRRMRAEWDSVDLEGEVSYSPEFPQKAVEVSLTVAEANAAHLSRLLQSAQRPPSGLLEKMRLRRSSMPDWLRNRNVSGVILIKTLNFASGSFNPLRLKFQWRADKFEATLSGSEFSMLNQPQTLGVEGKFSTELWQPAVQYRWDGLLAGWPVEKSTATLEGSFRSTSLDADWLDHLEGEAAFSVADNPKLVVHQGKVTLEYPDSKRRVVLLASPYWPLTIPAEP